MDIKQLIQWSLKHWWWFVISVAVCLILAGIRCLTSSYKHEVRATLMLRPVPESNEGPDAMMQIMGLKDKKMAGDEVKVLTSRDLVGRVVDELGLCTIYSKKFEGRWTEQFPNHELTASMNFTKPVIVKVFVKVKRHGYRVAVKRYHRFTEHYSLDNLNQPIHTAVGDLTLQLCDTISKGVYRATIIPRPSAVEIISSQLTVARLSRESNIITITTTTDSPRRMVATINTLLDFYNQESTEDKNILAVQTEAFLKNRIKLVEQELNEIEAAIENYKRSQKIADLQSTATTYKSFDDSYEQQVAEIDASLQLVDYISEQIDNPESAYAMLPVVSTSDVVNDLVQDYNEHIVHRNVLLQTATEENYVVVKENELLVLKRKNVKEAVVQHRQTLLLRRNELQKQQREYASRLSSIPETERLYLEMCREKETKEKQYIFLIEKREENAMLLSSEAFPARVVEKAQTDPEIASPKFSRWALIAMFCGALLPLLVYFFQLFRKEFL